RERDGERAVAALAVKGRVTVLGCKHNQRPACTVIHPTRVRADTRFFALTHTDTESTMKSGYLYVLVHASDPDLYKVGQTTRHPQERLVEHNSNYSNHAAGSFKRQVRNGFAVRRHYNDVR